MASASALQIFWDASGLVKRYYHETGSETVDTLFTAVPARHMTATPWTYSETYSILLRRFNGSVLDRQAFTGATTLLQAEVVYDRDFHLLTISDEAVFASLTLMRAHNINSVDAALLAVYLQAARALSPTMPGFLVTADQRLERASRAEHLPVLNPETVSAADIPALLDNLAFRT